MSSDLYREQILDLYKNPLNKGTIHHPTHEHEKNNPLCGDHIKIQLIIKGGIIKEVKFSGTGCAISMASASLITEKIKNMTVEEVQSLHRDDILALLSIQLSPPRLKCALLSLEVLEGAMNHARN